VAIGSHDGGVLRSLLTQDCDDWVGRYRPADREGYEAHAEEKRNKQCQSTSDVYDQ
jgi:hypothetical protein